MVRHSVIVLWLTGIGMRQRGSCALGLETALLSKVTKVSYKLAGDTDFEAIKTDSPKDLNCKLAACVVGTDLQYQHSERQADSVSSRPAWSIQ